MGILTIEDREVLIGLIWKDRRLKFPEELLDASCNEMWVLNVEDVLEIILDDSLSQLL